MLPLYSYHPIDWLCKSMGWFLCNGNTGMNWQSGWMVKVNVNLQIFLIVSSSKKNIRIKRTSKKNIILLFKQDGCKAVATWHRKKHL